MTSNAGQRSGLRLPVKSRLLLVFTLVTLAFVAMAPGASAARAWCRTDPLVVIDGTIADVFVSGPLLAPLKVTGPTKLVVTVPEGVTTQLILTDLGFLRGYDVKFQQSSELQKTDKGVEVRVQVYAQAARAALRGLDHDAAVARAEVDHVVALLHLGHAQHALDDLHRSLHVRHRAVVPAPGLHLRVQRQRDPEQKEQSCY